jgi:hypothetical protein
MVMVSKHWAEAHIPYRKTQKMAATNKKIGLKISDEETKYMIMCRD